MQQLKPEQNPTLLDTKKSLCVVLIKNKPYTSTKEMYIQHSKRCEGWEEAIGQVIREPIGKSLFVHYRVPMGTHIFATNGVMIISQGEYNASTSYSEIWKIQQHLFYSGYR